MSIQRSRLHRESQDHLPPPPLRLGRVLIVGQGLAGSFLADELERAGVDAFVADSGGPSASAVGAGLMTPLTGKRFAPNWRWPELSNVSKTAFHGLEQRWNVSLIRELDTLHFFADAGEQHAWALRRERGDADPWVDEVDEAECRLWPVRHPELGGLRLKGTCRVDLPSVLSGFRREFEKAGRLIPAWVEPSELQISSERVEWQGSDYDAAVFCDGYRAATNPLIAPLAFRNAHGEILDLKIPGLRDDTVLKQGVFLAPLGGNRFKCGATYSWSRTTPEPSDEGCRELEERLAAWFASPFEVVSRRAGIRPVALQRVPVIGCHPLHPRIGVFNGLGSKGALYAPTFARQFVDYLTRGIPLEREINLVRRIRRKKCD